MIYPKSHGLHKDLSQSELLSMREQGMSNAEIAEALGVGYQTILRNIGKQPREVRRNSARGGATVKPDFLEKRLNIPEEAPVACLAVEKSELFLTGAVARYRLDADRESITIINEAGEEHWAFETSNLDQFIRELQAIARNIEDSKQKLEMW